MDVSRKRVASFWYFVFLTIAAEALIAFIIYELLLRRGYVYTFRVAVSTSLMSFQYILLFCSAIFSAVTLGVFRKRDKNEVETTRKYLLSFVKHPIPLGSILLFLFSFLCL